MDKYQLEVAKNLTVLYVEDDIDLLKSTSKLLEEIFSHVDTAQDGLTGLEKYNQYYVNTKKFYDLIITDIQMPNLNGVKMSEKIYDMNSDQKIVVFSAYNDSEYLEKFIDLGVDGFIKKPFSFKEFTNKVLKVSLLIDAHKKNKTFIKKMDQLNQELEAKVQQRTKELEKLVNTDTLTGYGNRNKLNFDILHSTNAALAIINIDRFSQINDFYGHEKGDEVIIQLSKAIYKSLDSSKRTALYRLQGDEFVILYQGGTQEEFYHLIEEVLKSISSASILVDSEELYLQVSTAISFEKKEKLLISANMAKKVAKRRNLSYIVFQENISLDQEYKNNLKWVKKIKRGLNNDQFIPVFQPIVNNKNSCFEKYECLVRLQGENKLFSPEDFLSISKKTKQYMEITKIMLEKSFQIFSKKNGEFSINLTIEDILNKEISEYIFQLLQEYEIGSRVVFEIVESEYIENFEKVIVFIHKVNSYGAKIAIDDFGTGYSNFNYLIKLKADYIKIDGSLIKGIDADEGLQQIVATIVDFAKRIGMKTIAEYVENEAVFNKVKELGIDYSQGYYFGKPQSTV